MKIGTRATSLLGALFLIVGTVWLANLHEDSSIQSLYVIMGIEGIGFGLALTVFTLKVQSAVDWNLRGSANGSNNFIRGLGQTIGIAILGSVFNASLAGFFSDHPDMDMNKMLGHDGAGSISEPLLLLSKTALADGLQINFIILACITVLTILIPLWLPSKNKELAALKQ
ncbi:Multidrug resistance protein 3 [compost metagenome]